jgi:hypothetical protein
MHVNLTQKHRISFYLQVALIPRQRKKLVIFLFLQDIISFSGPVGGNADLHLSLGHGPGSIVKLTARGSEPYE